MASLPFVMIYLIPAIIATGLAIVMWQRRYYRGGRPFTLLLAAIAWWNLCHALSIADTTFEGTLFWSLLQNVGIVLIGPCWLLIALAYSGEWWRVDRRIRRGIFIPELIALIFALTNNLHYLWWSTVVADTSRPFLWLSVTRGPAFWFHSMYAYLCLATGIIILIRASAQAPPVHRYHSRLMLAAALIPAVGNIAFLSGLKVPWNDDPTPILLLISAALAMYTTMRYQLFDLAPLAEQEVIAGLPDGLIVLDSRGLVAEINQHAPRLLGIQQGRWIGRSLTSLIVNSPFERDLQRLLNTPVSGPSRPVICENSTQAIEVRLRPLQSAAGITTGSLLLIRDVSERIRAEQERARHIAALRLINSIARSANTAQETSTLLKTIANTIVQEGHWERAAIGLINNAQHIHVVIDATATGCGRLHDQIVSGAAASALIERIQHGHPELINLGELTVEDPLAVALQQEGLQSLLLAPLRHDQHAAGILGLASSETKSMTPTLTELVIAIGELITDALIRIRLYEEVQRADRLKTGFLATVSHELRTPLTTIIGYTDMLRRGVLGDLSPEIQETLHYMRQASLNLMRLISDILEFSRMEAGQLTIDIEPVPVPVIVQNVVGQMQPQIREHQLHLMVNIPPDLPMIQANAGRLEQVLINLLSNAIKFNRPQGLIEIKAETRGEWVRISVRDTGIGIAPADQERIFEEFERVKQKNGQAVSGVGLGLAICRRLIQHMGGKIGVESTPGEGSTFFCDLPVVPVSRTVGAQADV
ncbi:histidine kinase N-terminal 7TM domain-containing protein [Chloroflexus sp.]|uniref:histidine kinase N-terminal 7TM domain-containing protein n=1 Tax=Chloroflexus sp. TaxID=1904827 RepID=UPI004049821B